MAVSKRVAATGSRNFVSYPAASVIPFGAAVCASGVTAGSETIKAVEAETSILGLAGVREYLPKGGTDGFWAAYEQVEIVDDVGYALVTPNGADVDIELNDFLQVAVLGDGTPGNHGVLEEAAAGTGNVFTIACVAKALQSVDMGSKSYKVPASNVAIGDTSITMTGTDIATMGLSVGDYIQLEDLNGACQTNKVAALPSATTITLALASTVALTAGNNDLVTRLYPCLVKLIK